MAEIRLSRGIFILAHLGLLAIGACSQKEATVTDILEVEEQENGPTFEDVLGDEALDLNEDLWKEEESLEKAALLASQAVLEVSEGGGQRFRVAASSLNVRKGPGLKFPTVDKMEEGTVVDVSRIQEEWARVGEGKWVAMRFLNLIAP
ncbi:MAG: SH3 domain-containing protein [Deltaproteobacteria bacterium]|nr:SH3 domain-containing protein [Deltaproteobacteria bacterium]